MRPVACVSAEPAARQPKFAQARYLAVWRDRGEAGANEGIARGKELGAELRRRYM